VRRTPSTCWTPAAPSPSPSAAAFIKRVRDNARRCAEGYLKLREKLGYPLTKTSWTVGQQLPVLEGKPASEYWKTGAVSTFRWGGRLDA